MRHSPCLAAPDHPDYAPPPHVRSLRGSLESLCESKQRHCHRVPRRAPEQGIAKELDVIWVSSRALDTEQYRAVTVFGWHGRLKLAPVQNSKVPRRRELDLPEGVLAQSISAGAGGSSVRKHPRAAQAMVAQLRESKGIPFYIGVLDDSE